jgi:isoaspartyl peptidase/L-asparaginase-like protein (Ntn-hydrolase superfamily)
VIREKTHVRRERRARMIGLFVLYVAFAAGVAAQKASRPEIKQLQGPQNPTVGFMMHGRSAMTSLTPESEKRIADTLKAVIEKSYKALRSGTSASRAVQMALKAPGFSSFSGTVVGVIALDKSRHIAAVSTRGISSDGPATSANELCGVSVLGPGPAEEQARRVCDDVLKKASTIQSAVDARPMMPGAEQAIIAIDKFGNMALKGNPAGTYRAYMAASGPVVEIFRK